MKKLLCKIFGHKLRYNFVVNPSKCVCARCEQKFLVGNSGYNFQMHLVEVDDFYNDTRSSKVLINKWFKL